MARQPGRPPLDPRYPSAQLSIKLPSKQLIDLCAQAHRERKTLPELVRDLLRPHVLQNKET